MSSIRLVRTAALAAAALAAAAAQAQTWDYKSYKKVGGTGQYDKEKFVAGTITLSDEKDGQGTFTLHAGRTDLCYRGGLPAKVTRTPETTLIEVTQPVPGCDVFRYTIRNDGSGGFKETLNGDRWVRSRFDHGLTPVR